MNPVRETLRLSGCGLTSITSKGPHHLGVRSEGCWSRVQKDLISDADWDRQEVLHGQGRQSSSTGESGDDRVRECVLLRER